MPKILLFILALAVFAVFATGCGTDHAKVRFVHASPGSPDAGPVNVDVAVDGKTVVTDLAFGGVSPATDYLSVEAGNRRVEVRNTGTTTDLINSTVDFASQKTYTFLVSGKASDDNIAALLKTDDNSAPSAGNVKLRVIHDAPDGPPSDPTRVDHIDIYVVAPATDITNITPTISNLAYQQASQYLNVTPANNEIIVTDSTDSSKTRIIDQTLTLTAGQIRTLVTVDEPDGSTMSATLLELSDLN